MTSAKTLVLSTRQYDYLSKAICREGNLEYGQVEIREFPDGEREEVRQILESKGLSGGTLDDAVRCITEDEATWIELMLREEFGIAGTSKNPTRAAAATFASFVACGTVPLVPFLLDAPRPFFMASVAASFIRGRNCSSGSSTCLSDTDLVVAPLDK